jgi:hypothetical protein
MLFSLPISSAYYHTQEQKGKIKPDSNLIYTLSEESNPKDVFGLLQISYKSFKEGLQLAGINIINQTFLMQYSNFEAYLTDVVMNAFMQKGVIEDPYEKTLHFLSTSKWHGKIHSITNKFEVKLGDRIFIERFKNIQMSFLKQEYNKPLDFLESWAEIRHRIVHYNGIADKTYLDRFPNSMLHEGQTIRIPAETALSMQTFFFTLTDVIDEAFAFKFGWERKIVDPYHV